MEFCISTNLLGSDVKLQISQVCIRATVFALCVNKIQVMKNNVLGKGNVFYS